MEGIWIVSYVILWVVVFALVVVLLTLVKLVDQIRRRLLIALDRGPRVGQPLADLLKLLPGSGAGPLLDFPIPQPVLLLLIRRPGSLSDEMLQAAAKGGKARFETVVVSTSADLDLSKRLSGVLAPIGFRYRVIPGLMQALQIEGDSFGIIIDREGVVLSRGMVENVEQMELLVLKGLGNPDAS